MATTTTSHAKFKKVFGFWDAVAIMFNGMVGSGIFFTIGHIVKEVSHPLAVLGCWLVGGILAIAGAHSLAGLALLYPHAGGEYIYLRQAFGKLPAFLNGWICLIISFSGSISVLALALAEHFQSLFPASKDIMGIYELSLLGLEWQWGLKQLIACSLIVLMTLFNTLSPQWVAKALRFFFHSKMILFAVIVVGGILIGQGSLQNWNSGIIAQKFSFKGWWVGLLFVNFSFLGWNMISYVAEEVNEPQKVILPSIWLSCLLVTLLYCVVNVLFLFAAPSAELAGQNESGRIALRYLFSPYLGSTFSPLITGVIMWVISGALLSFILGGPRIYLAMARDRIFFSRFAELSTQHSQPVQALILQAMVALILCHIKTLESLLSLVTVSILLISILISCTPFKLKFQLQKSPIKGWYAATAVYLITNLITMISVFWAQPEESIWGLFLLLAGIPVYFAFQARR